MWVSQWLRLMRLHSGNFDFSSVNIDGSDIRLIAADDKTELKFYIEKFDALNELATIWVQLPAIPAGEKDAHIWVYSGNENATSASNEKNNDSSQHYWLISLCRKCTIKR